MARSWSIALGIGMILVWIAGLNFEATPWLTWIDGLAALVSFGIAGSLYPGRTIDKIHGIRENSAGPLPVALGVGLFALWAIGLSTHATLWLSWWTFAFGVAYFAVGTGIGRPFATRGELTDEPRTSTDEIEDEDRRRSA